MGANTNLERMRELIERLTEADIAYYKNDAPIMTDLEYDRLTEDLASLEHDTGLVLSGSPTQKVSGEILESLAEVRHTKPMLSAGKTKSIEDLIRFAAGRAVLLSWKMDGLTLVLRYEYGKLKQAITRGREGKAELDEVVNTLREKNGLLCTRDSMTRFCYQNPEAEFEGNYCAEYGFKVQTPQHTYMLRCNPNYGDYNFYLYAYVSRFLEHHMEKAKQGIRFITPGYKELFRIPDGDHIRIFTGGGETRDRTCRVIDETHFETSGGYSSALYHICEFAERLEQTHGSVIPLRSSLPVQCFSVLPSSGELILLTRGEKGYSPCYDFSTPDAQQNREFADDRNVKNGVTKAQEAAMLAGSMLGWQTPAADPRNYDEQGQPIKPRQKDRGEAR